MLRIACYGLAFQQANEIDLRVSPELYKSVSYVRLLKLR